MNNRTIKLAYPSRGWRWPWTRDELGSTEADREQTRRWLRSLGGVPAPENTPQDAQDARSAALDDERYGCEDKTGDGAE